MVALVRGTTVTSSPSVQASVASPQRATLWPAFARVTGKAVLAGYTAAFFTETASGPRIPGRRGDLALPTLGADCGAGCGGPALPHATTVLVGGDGHRARLDAGQPAAARLGWVEDRDLMKAGLRQAKTEELVAVRDVYVVLPDEGFVARELGDDRAPVGPEHAED